MKYKLLMILLSVALTGCAGMGERYADSFIVYTAGQVFCMQNDVVSVKSYDREGNIIAETNAPAGHCGKPRAPTHEAEILMPAVATLGGAAIAATALIYQDKQQTKRSIRQSEASEIISRENRLSDQSMFSALSGITESQQSTIDQLIQELPEPVIESEGDSMEMGEVGVGENL